MIFSLRAYLAGDLKCLPGLARPNACGRRRDVDQLGTHTSGIRADTTRESHSGTARTAWNENHQGLWGGGWRGQLDILETGDGWPLSRYIKAEITRESERVRLVLDQVEALEAERRDTPLMPIVVLAALNPALRQTSPALMPSQACLSTKAICASALEVVRSKKLDLLIARTVS